MHRENALNPLAERHLAHRERGTHAAASQIDDHAFEDLDALLVAFLDPDVHAHRIARLHPRPFGELSLYQHLDGAHHSLPFSFTTCARESSISRSSFRSSSS